MVGAELLSPTPHSACPEPHSSPRAVPTPQAQAPARGDSPQNPTPSPGHAVLGGDSAAEGPTGTGQRCQLPPASRLVKHSTPKGTRCRQGWKQPSLRRAPNAASPSASTQKISCQERERTASPAPVTHLVLGQKTKILSSGVAQRSNPLLSEVQ